MKEIEKKLCSFSKLQIIDISKVYYDGFIDISEYAFYKTISRLNKAGKIARISKGIYCVPQHSKYGTLVSGESDIIKYYLGKNNGVLIGYKLYNKYAITTQISKKVIMYSNIIYENQKNITNVNIKKANIKFTHDNVNIIELLEILENYKYIEDINYDMLVKTLKNLSEKYTEKSFNEVIKNIKYKKSTLASLKFLLDFYNIENSVGKHLRKTSKYKIINLEKIYELAS